MKRYLIVLVYQESHLRSTLKLKKIYLEILCEYFCKEYSQYTVCIYLYTRILEYSHQPQKIPVRARENPSATMKIYFNKIAKKYLMNSSEFY